MNRVHTPLIAAVAVLPALCGCRARSPNEVERPPCDVALACCDLARSKGIADPAPGAPGCIGKDLGTRDFGGGTDIAASGMESSNGVLRLRQRVVTRSPVVWVTSTGENKVAKYDSANGREMLRVPTWGAFPNRTAVAADGSVWITNRDSGSYVHVAADGSVACASAYGTCKTRAASIDSRGDVWIGCHDKQTLIRVSASQTSGTVEVTDAASKEKGQVPKCAEIATLPVPVAPYGLAADGEGNLWTASYGGRSIARIDTAGGKVAGVYDVAADPTLQAAGRGCWDPYGIAIDQEGNPWYANLKCHDVVKIDARTGRVAGVFFGGPDGMATPRALGIDLSGHVWVAEFDAPYVDEFKPNGAWVKRVDVSACGGRSAGPLGTGSDVDGAMWTVLYHTGKIVKYRPAGDVVGCYPDGKETPLLRSPYTYSDLTGSTLGLVTSKLGRWRTVVEQDRLLRWLLVSYRATAPAKTRVCLRVRSASTRASLAKAGWTDPFCEVAPGGATTTWPLARGDGTSIVANAPVLEIEVQLSSQDPAVTPTIADLSVAAEVAPPAKDRDGDGIADDVDACPEAAEDHRAPFDDDGCPDRDGDGIADSTDACPDQAEDHRAPRPRDGCPDTDADGIADPEDKCPDAREDGHAPAPADGCPDADSDGVIDKDDKCPHVKGEPKYAGCPLVHAAETEIKLADKVLFEEGSAKIDAKSDELLDGIAQLLQADPKIEFVEIAGHANRHGTAARNAKLTKDRAAAVLAALVKRGVDPKRLVAAGYTDFCPAVPGDTPEADDANRRVELKILKRAGAPTGTRWGGCAEAEKKGMKPPVIPGVAPPKAPPKAAPAPPPAKAPPAKPPPAKAPPPKAPSKKP